MLISTILSLISSILSIVEMNIRRKYIDRYLELEKAWYEAYNQPREKRNNALLDTLEFEIITLARTVQADADLAKK